MKEVILFLLLINISLNLFSQEKKIEIIYQDCLYNSLSDKGFALKRYAKGFEDHLIALKILKNNTARSYKKLLKSLSQGKRYNIEFQYNYLDSIHTIEVEKIIPRNKECTEIIRKNKDYTGYVQRFKSLPSASLSVNQGLKNLYKKLSANDFELDYYKQKIFMLIYMTKDLESLDIE